MAMRFNVGLYRLSIGLNQCVTGTCGPWLISRAHFQLQFTYSVRLPKIMKIDWE